MTTQDQLKSIVERIERLCEEKDTISLDIREVYAEAHGNGFDKKALRSLIRLRRLDPEERAEREQILETYLVALGMLAEPRLENSASTDAEGPSILSAG